MNISTSTAIDGKDLCEEKRKAYYDDVDDNIINFHTGPIYI